MKKISIGSWAYVFGPYSDHPVPLDTVIKELGQMKYDGISLGGFKPHAHFELYPTKEDCDRLLNQLRQNGLEVVDYSPDVNIYNPILEQDKYLKLLEKFLVFMEQCGFTILRLDTGVPPVIPDGLTYEQAFEKMADTFTKATRMAATHGIEVVWEFEPGFLFNKPSEVVRMVEAVNDDNFSVLFDTCHAHMCAVVGARQLGKKETLPGGVLEFIDMLSGKIGLVHLIDSDETLHDDDTSTHRPFGEGVIDFDAVVPALLDQGKYTADWWVIDLCFWPDAWEVTRGSKAFVDKLNQKYCNDRG